MAKIVSLIGRFSSLSSNTKGLIYYVVFASLFALVVYFSAEYVPFFAYFIFFLLVGSIVSFVIYEIKKSNSEPERDENTETQSISVSNNPENSTPPPNPENSEIERLKIELSEKREEIEDLKERENKRQELGKDLENMKKSAWDWL